MTVTYETRIDDTVIDSWENALSAVSHLLTLSNKDSMVAVQGCSFHMCHVPFDVLIREMEQHGSVVVQNGNGHYVSANKITPPQTQTS